MFDETIGKIRESVSNVTGISQENVAKDTPLGLDSINRITLITEIENDFEIIIESESLEPEIFETLETLAIFIETCLEAK